MNKFLFFICFFFLVFSLSACTKKEDTSFVPSLQGKVSYTDKDATKAFDSFILNLKDPSRNLFYRDTDKPEKLGAIWTQAIYWDMIMNAYKRTGKAEYLQLMEDVYQGGYTEYAGYDWTNHVEWFIWDDMMWWIIAMGRAYEVTGEQKYLDHAVAGFSHVWSGSYDAVNGGMDWAWTQEGKTSCINYPTVIGAMTLFNITKDSVYLDKAEKIYAWANKNLFDASNGRVADSKVGSNQPDWSLHTYNQATCIGGAVMLYLATKEQHYLDDAVLTADYTKNVMSDTDGILPFETGEEQGVYNAILAQYMIRLIEDCNKPDYLPWLRKNINTAWGNRDVTRCLTTKNYKISCPTDQAISCYDACSLVALMQVCSPDSVSTN